MEPAPLILASGSPRRRELLGEMGVPFEVVTAEVSELDGLSAPEMTAGELALTNARAKAEAVARRFPGRWVLGADTVVAWERRVHRGVSSMGICLAETHAIDRRVFGKPASLAEAGEFLRMLSGRTHEVITACVLISPKGETEEVLDTSQVTFHELSGEVIERYLATVQVLDKAGGYALQEHGDWIIEKVEGSRANVIGLPVGKLEPLLRRAFGNGEVDVPN